MVHKINCKIKIGLNGPDGPLARKLVVPVLYHVTENAFMVSLEPPDAKA